MPQKKPKVMVVDDHAIFRKGLILSLQGIENLQIIGEAENGRTFLERLPVLQPDLVIMDIKMPEIDGFEAAQKALTLRPGLKILVLTMFDELPFFQRMVDIGVSGFLLKTSDPGELQKAITRVLEGDNYFSPELIRKSAEFNAPHKNHDRLSSRELEILQEICKGYSNQEIAEKLNISRRTVDGHRASLLDKTGSKNTAALIIYAVKNGLIPL